MKKGKFIEDNKKIIGLMVIALVVLFGTTYAWLQITLHGTKTTRIEAGTLVLTLDESTSNGINVEDATPMLDIDGLKTEAYTFSVENEGSITSEYAIYLDDTPISEDDFQMNDSIVKYSLVKNGGEATTALVSTLQDKKLTETTQLEPGKTDTYSLRFWIKSTAQSSDIQTQQEDGTFVGNVFSKKIRIEANQIKE